MFFFVFRSFFGTCFSLLASWLLGFRLQKPDTVSKALASKRQDSRGARLPSGGAQRLRPASVVPGGCAEAPRRRFGKRAGRASGVWITGMDRHQGSLFGLPQSGLTPRGS